ncbi:MAG: hypothetical protein L0Y71_26045 [Gemmataceae bacterium]|nr:hypothetical protein [Gemmataceae bacterium]
MLKASHRIPRYGKHRATGQARVVLNGRSIYLGPYGSPKSREAYQRAINEWLARGRTTARSGLTIVELILAFWKHALVYYRKPNGVSTGELYCIKSACRPLRDLYGQSDADAFGPKELKAVRQAMIANGWVRKSINRNIERIRRMFRWAGEQGIVPPEIYHRLLCVSGLKVGRTDAKEGHPVKPVPEALIDVVRPHVWRPVRAMIELQLLTGMRPGEVCQMRGCDLEISGHVWIYRPANHKTQHFGHGREIFLGPQAQALLRPFLKTDLQAFLFSPAEAREEHFLALRGARKTKVQPSQMCRKVESPRKLPGIP